MSIVTEYLWIVPHYCKGGVLSKRNRQHLASIRVHVMCNTGVTLEFDFQHGNVFLKLNC